MEFEEGPESEIRRPKMDENQDRTNNLIDTTDCLEAVGVFKGWKNFLFIIIILSLLLLQVSFWLVDTKVITTGGVGADDVPAAADDEPTQTVTDATAEPNQPAKEAQEQKEVPRFGVTFKQLSWLIRFLDFVLIPASILYSLTMLFSLKVSMLGRLGGISHISRAFFLSLTFVVLLLPWQKFFGGVVAGAMYTPAELLSSCQAQTRGIFPASLYYLRFSGYWVLVMLLLIFSQARSFRWAKTILRRLEVI